MTDDPTRHVNVAGALTPLTVTPGLDVLTPPDPRCPSTDFTDHGGEKVTAPVQVLHWGGAWHTLRNPDNVAELYADALTRSVRSILSGPWMSALRQYGVHRCPFGGSRIIDSPSPPATPSQYDKGDVEDMIQGLIDDGTFPEPDEPGGRNLYVVFMPPGTSPEPVGGIAIDGEHSHFHSGSLIDADTVWYAFVSVPAGAGGLDHATSDFSHELAEMCTDPADDGWRIDGAGTGCTEIADVCNKQSGFVNGVSVSAYWSKVHRGCLIPTAWRVRDALTYAGIRLDGRGLRSLQNPILSLNRFVVNL